jgi:hypothetical protein
MREIRTSWFDERGVETERQSPRHTSTLLRVLLASWRFYLLIPPIFPDRIARGKVLPEVTSRGEYAEAAP